jgi:hypothetical protein
MDKLKQLRKSASLKSGGMSDLIIKDKIIYNLKKFKTNGKSLLDFGAGKGVLISILLQKFNFKVISGADL